VLETLGCSPEHVLLLHENDLAALFISDFAKLFLKEAGKLFGLWRVIMARLQRPWDNLAPCPLDSESTQFLIELFKMEKIS